MSDSSEKRPVASAKVVPLRKTRRCPICDKPSARASYPFCSRRCADIDLNRWLKGSYAIPAVEEEPGRDDNGAA
jgi:endogenous inhibitor of DNA gyrase (YacG/DUF329 family)